jgi:hypothetical protein
VAGQLDRLRGEVEDRVREINADLGAARAEQAALQQAAAEQAEREQAREAERELEREDARQREAREQEAREQEARALADRGGLAAEAAERVRAERAADTARLVDSIRRIDHALSLSEVLNALIDTAGREAARVGLLLAGDTGYRGWRFTGFGPAFEPPAQIAQDHAGAIADAVRSGDLVTDAVGNGDGVPAFARPLAGRPFAAVPLLVGGQAVAVLYVDSGAAADEGESAPQNPEVLEPERIEILARHAAQRLEVITAIKAAKSLAAAPVRQNAPTGQGGIRPPEGQV